MIKRVAEACAGEPCTSVCRTQRYRKEPWCGEALARVTAQMCTRSGVGNSVLHIRVVRPGIGVGFRVRFRRQSPLRVPCRVSSHGGGAARTSRGSKLPAWSFAWRSASDTPLITSSGSMTLPRDLDILRPYLSRTCNGGDESGWAKEREGLSRGTMCRP